MSEKRVGKIAVPENLKLGTFCVPAFSIGTGQFPNKLVVSFNESGVSVSWPKADAKVCERVLNALEDLEIPELK